MKKLAILIVMAALFTSSATAQSKEMKADEKVLKNTIKDKKEERKEMAKDASRLRLRNAMHGRRHVRHDRKSIHRQGKHMKYHGAKRPIIKARRKAKAEKEMQESKS